MSAKRGDLPAVDHYVWHKRVSLCCQETEIMNDLIETVRAGRLTQIYFDRFEGTAHKARARMARNCHHGIAARLLYFGIVWRFRLRPDDRLRESRRKCRGNIEVLPVRP